MQTVVVGGGAVGLSAAYFLRKAGREVTVVSRDPIGIGASAGNAGMIVPSHVVPLSAPGVVAQGLRWLASPESPFYIKPRLDLDLARWLWSFTRHCTVAHVRHAIPILRDLSLESVDLFGEMQDEIGDVGFAQTGLLMVYRSDKTKKDALEAADLAESAGLEVERLDAAALRDREPGLRSPSDGAVLYHQDGRVDSDALLHRLAEWLRANGVTVLEGETADLEVAGGCVTGVRTPTSVLEAETVVLAAGAWTGRMAKRLGQHVPLQPAKGYSVTVDGDHGLTYPTILLDDKITATPLPGRLRFAGTLSLAGFDPSVDERRSAPIRRLAKEYTGLEVAPTDLWSGYRPCSPDGLPIVGRMARHPNVILATGHGMMGVTLAPVTGRLVADALEVKTPPFSGALDPSRF